MRPRGSARRLPASRPAIALLAVLVLAKAATLAGAHGSIAPIAVLVCFWQDVAVALLFGAADVAFGQRRWAWGAYVVVVVYVAINVPVATVLASPLTWPLIRAARGALSDSIAYYLTLRNVASMAMVLVAAAMLPRLLTRIRTVPAWAVATLGAVMIAGASASAHVETRGVDRNALTALAVWPRVSASAPAPPGWRDSRFESASPGHAVLRGSARGMNVLVVILESTAAQYLGTYGAAEDPMPTLHRISRSALVFDAAYAVYPESIKGLYAAMCAKSSALGATMDDVLKKEAGSCVSPARAMGAAGYATALFHSGRFGYLGMDTLVASLGFDHLEDAGAIGGHVQSSFGVDEASTSAHVLSWIDTIGAARPFFAVYMPVAGHHPYAANVPGPFRGDTDLARYRNALHETDDALAALVAGLDARGRLDRTMLVVFGDHGEAFGQHPGNIGHTLFIHDENVRVPYLISIPGVIRTQVRDRAPASVLDTVPTVLDLAGLAVPAGLEGRSLIDGGTRVAPFFADYSLNWLGLRDGCWKYQLNASAGQSHLYNVCDDPAESVDRAAEQPARVAAYRQTVTAWK